MNINDKFVVIELNISQLKTTLNKKEVNVTSFLLNII